MAEKTDLSAWYERASTLRAMAAHLSEIAQHFNLERKSCTCGESHRWKDMTQWQMHERMVGLVARLTNIAVEIDHHAPTFIPKTENTP